MSDKDVPDHDQRFKVLVQEFFREFLFCFFPDWAERFDYTALDWLTQEVFPDPPQGERRALDLVCRLRLKASVPPPFEGGAEGGLVLVHIEIESNDRIAGFRRRFFEYYTDLRRKHDLPVWPIGLFLRVGLNGVGWTTYEETFWGQRLLEFTFAYVGLPALDAETYLAGENLLGVALTALMRVPRERRGELRAEALDRIIRSGQNDIRRHLLAECVAEYAELDRAEWDPVQRLFVTPKSQGVRPTMPTIKDHLRHDLRIEDALFLLQVRFGELPDTVKKRVEAMTEEQVRQLLTGFARGQSLKELGLED
jgi:hypothetical protein